MSKYHNKKITVNGEAFDSRKEFRRWQELQLLERSGLIKNLRRQVKYVLIPAQYEMYPRFSGKTGKRLKDGKRLVEKECSYIADFVYSHFDGSVSVEDTKGVKTDAYIMKRKLMLWVHGIKIIET
jgi:hypothetical protein